MIFTLNEEIHLPSCLDALGWCDDVIVVDSYSTDRTEAICRARGARFFQNRFEGFGSQRNWALDNAQPRHPWVLILDADERVTPELAAAIRALFAGGAPAASASAFPRRNRFLGRWLAHGEGYPDWSLRLFDRRHARWSDDPVHEKVVADGPVIRLRGDLLHASAESIDNYIAKQNRYTTVQAAAMHARGERAGAAQLVLSPVVRFLRFYLLRLGFLDGAAGFAHIAIGAYASFLKYAKLRALNNEGRAG